MIVAYFGEKVNTFYAKNVMIRQIVPEKISRKTLFFVRGWLHAMLIFTTFRSILASIKSPARSAKASLGNFTRLGWGKIVKINWVCQMLT